MADLYLDPNRLSVEKLVTVHEIVDINPQLVSDASWLSSMCTDTLEELRSIILLQMERHQDAAHETARVRQLDLVPMTATTVCRMNAVQIDPVWLHVSIQGYQLRDVHIVIRPWSLWNVGQEHFAAPQAAFFRVVQVHRDLVVVSRHVDREVKFLQEVWI